jgi:TetR/AcrR family fatty acid metabolism transcriptional regulator
MNDHSGRRAVRPAGRVPRGRGTRRGASGGRGEPNGAAAGSDKRRRILEAAVRVFAEHGFFNARVADIADAAGIADGTIYLYFKNKDDLLISLFELHADRLMENLKQAMSTPEIEGAPIDRKLRRCIELHLLLAQKDRALAEVFTIELRQSRKFMKEYDNPRFSEYLSLLTGLISQGQAEGLFNPELTARTVARALFGSIDEVIVAYLLGRRSRPDLSRAATEIADIFIGGMLVPGAERAPSLPMPEGGSPRPARAKLHRRTP